MSAFLAGHEPTKILFVWDILISPCHFTGASQTLAEVIPTKARMWFRIDEYKLSKRSAARP